MEKKDGLKNIIWKEASHAEITAELRKAVKEDNFESFKKIWVELYNHDRDKEITRLIMLDQPIEGEKSIEELLWEQAKKSLSVYDNGGGVSGEHKEMLKKLESASIIPSEITEKYEIIKETYPDWKDKNAETIAKQRKAELEKQGYSVKLKKWDFTDLGRGYSYSITAIKDKVEIKAGGGTTGHFKFNIGDQVMVDDSGYVSSFGGFDLSKPATINNRFKHKYSTGIIYSYQIKTADGRIPFNNAKESKLTLVEPAKAKQGIGISTMIKIKPEEVKAGQLYHITDKEDNKFGFKVEKVIDGLIAKGQKIIFEEGDKQVPADYTVHYISLYGTLIGNKEELGRGGSAGKDWTKPEHLTSKRDREDLAFIKELYEKGDYEAALNYAKTLDTIVRDAIPLDISKKIGFILTPAGEKDFKEGKYGDGGILAEISKMKKKLIAKVKSKGLYENFGRKEVKELEDKYGYKPEIADFDNWIDSVDLSTIAAYGDGGGVGNIDEDYVAHQILKENQYLSDDESATDNWSDAAESFIVKVGYKGKTAGVAYIIGGEYDNPIMLEKKMLREIAKHVLIKGIEKIELFTNAGVELHTQEVKQDEWKKWKIHKIGEKIEQYKKTTAEEKEATEKMWQVFVQKEPNGKWNLMNETNLTKPEAEKLKVDLEKTGKYHAVKFDYDLPFGNGGKIVSQDEIVKVVTKYDPDYAAEKLGGDRVKITDKYSNTGYIYTDGTFSNINMGLAMFGVHKLFGEKHAEGGTVEQQRIEEILQHYVMAALWSTANMHNEEEEMLDENYSFDDVDEKTLNAMRADIKKFITENAEAIKESGMDDEQLGHDLWLSRNGHGAGFFDRGYDKEVEKKLMDASRLLKGTDLEVGDDGKIYAMGIYGEGGGVEDKSTYRVNQSANLRFANFNNYTSHINLVKLKPFKSHGHGEYKDENKYAISIVGFGDKQKVIKFKSLDLAEKRFDELVNEKKAKSNSLDDIGEHEHNYSKGGEIGIGSKVEFQGKEYIVTDKASGRDWVIKKNIDDTASYDVYEHMIKLIDKKAKGGSVKDGKEYLYCETVSGEGYSSPTFAVKKTYDEAKAELRREIKNLEGDGYVFDERNPNDFGLQLAGDTDDEDYETEYYRLQIIEVPARKYHLVYYFEPNEVKVTSFDTEELARVEMNKELAKIKWEDDSEYNEYKGTEHAFGSIGKGEAGYGYNHYQIVSFNELLGKGGGLGKNYAIIYFADKKPLKKLYDSAYKAFSDYENKGSLYAELYNENDVRLASFPKKSSDGKMATGGGVKGKKDYNRDVEAYKWFVVHIPTKKAISGFEFSEDARDLLKDFGEDRINYKVVGEKALKAFGVKNPKEDWYEKREDGTKYNDGGNVYCPRGSKLQTVLMPKKNFTKTETTAWAKKHKLKTGIDETANYYSLRQLSPEQFTKGSFRTMSWGRGIKGVIACPKK